MEKVMKGIVINTETREVFPLPAEVDVNLAPEDKVFQSPTALRNSEYTSKDLAEFIATLTGDGVKRPSTKEAAAKRLFKLAGYAESAEKSVEKRHKPSSGIQAAAGRARKQKTRVRARKYDPETELVWLYEENPKKGKGGRRADKYWGAETVGEFYALGGTGADLSYDLKRGLVKLS